MRTIIALAMLLAASVANAQQQRPQYSFMGIGVGSCLIFSQNVRQNQSLKVHILIGHKGLCRP